MHLVVLKNKNNLNLIDINVKYFNDSNKFSDKQIWSNSAAQEGTCQVEQMLEDLFPDL